MNDYSGTSVDLFMRHTLETDLSPEETDNTLTLLTTLTTLAGDTFPHGETFARVSKTQGPQSSSDYVQGVVFFTLDETGKKKHSVFVGKSDLGNLNSAMEALFAILTYGVLTDG